MSPPRSLAAKPRSGLRSVPELQKKSRLEPSQVTTFLGMVLDSRRATVALTLERQQAFRTCLALFQLHAPVNWGLCFHLMGLMAAMVQVVPLAVLHMRPVQRCLLAWACALRGPTRPKWWSLGGFTGPSGGGGSQQASRWAEPWVQGSIANRCAQTYPLWGGAPYTKAVVSTVSGPAGGCVST